MRPRLVFALVPVLLLLPGCIVPFVVPPLRGDLGAGAVVTPEGDGIPGTRASVGAHVLAVQPRRAPGLDVGVGYVADRRTGDDPLVAHGGYVEGSVVVPFSPFVRATIGPRLELVGREHALGFGIAARVSLEAHRGVSGKVDLEGTRCGAALAGAQGTAALGLYAEVGGRTFDGLAPFASIGMTVRSPLMGGVWMGIPFMPGC